MILFTFVDSYCFLTISQFAGIYDVPYVSGKSAGQVNVPEEETFDVQFVVAFVGSQAEKFTFMLFRLVQPENIP